MARPTGSRGSVLVVEDETTIAEIVAEYLRRPDGDHHAHRARRRVRPHRRPPARRRRLRRQALLRRRARRARRCGPAARRHLAGTRDPAGLRGADDRPDGSPRDPRRGRAHAHATRVRPVAVPGPAPGAGLHALRADGSGLAPFLHLRHVDRDRAHPAAAEQARAGSRATTLDRDGMGCRLPVPALKTGLLAGIVALACTTAGAWIAYGVDSAVAVLRLLAPVTLVTVAAILAVAARAGSLRRQLALAGLLTALGIGAAVALFVDEMFLSAHDALFTLLLAGYALTIGGWAAWLLGARTVRRV